MSQADKRPGWHWSDYWRSGRAEVMTVDTPDGPVTFDTGAIWTGWFASFETGARLLDLATGSGQVARYAGAAATTGAKSFDVTGVDYADVASAGAQPAAGFTVLGGVPLEKLPFPAASFDGASSQFGIEYADTRLALAELSRVLEPGGRALMLIHHADSAITRHTEAQIAAYDRVLGNGGAIRQGRRAFTAQLKGLPAPARQSAEQAFRETVGRAAGRLEPGPAFDPVRYLVGYLDDLASRVASYEPASAMARLDAFEAGNAAWRRRQHCQTQAALDDRGLDAFVARADRVGLALTDRSRQDDLGGALIGWRVAFCRA